MAKSQDQSHPNKIARRQGRALICESRINQTLLSGDVCMTAHLHARGGKGYDHVPVNFRPLPGSPGVTDNGIRAMTVVNPASRPEIARLEERPGLEPAAVRVTRS
jgi:predicted metal-dependent phosphotriesterase family hydrolase